MRLAILSFSLASAAVLSGCGGDDVAESVSGVFPSSGFSGRVVRVEISGDTTEWGSNTTLDFGADVTVGTVTVASPTSLFADVTIAPTAALGPRDVNVKTGSKTLTLKSSFKVDAPIE